MATLTVTTLEITGRDLLVAFANGKVLENYPAPQPAQGPFPDSPNVIAAGPPNPSVNTVSVPSPVGAYGAKFTSPSEAISYLALNSWNLSFVIGTMEFPVYYFVHS